MKYIKLFEELEKYEDEWEFTEDWEENDKTQYRIITLDYARTRYRYLQFKKVENKKTFWGKEKKEVKWFFIPIGKHIDIYGERVVYPVEDIYYYSSIGDPYKFIHIELESDDSDNYLIKWAKEHPYIQEYLNGLEQEYKEYLRKKKEEKDRISYLDDDTEYIDLD